MHRLRRHIRNAAAQYEALRLRYTPRQLYYETCRTVWGGQVPEVMRRFRFTLPAPLPFAQFAQQLDTMQTAGFAPLGLLNQASMLLPPADLPELAAYGLPRLLICADAEIAAMLRANGVALELACPILSLEEATPLPAAYARMLALVTGRVFFLHHADPAGLALATDAEAQVALPNQVSWQPLGLRPAHALRLHLFTQPAQATSLPADLTTHERRWLQQRRAELDAIPPVRLFRALRHLLAGDPHPAPMIKRLRTWPHSGFMSWPT